MKVDHVLILAAGKGTRMGGIGKQIPKVIWPIFEKTLLQLEVAYAKYLAPGADIYINLYNYSDKICAHIEANPESFRGVNIIIEEEALDIGGAIHNLASKITYSGNLLILNSDQFLFCGPKVIEDAILGMQGKSGLLFAYEVESSKGYNSLNVENGYFCGVTPNKVFFENRNILTYTGMSILALDQIVPKEGPSSFFSSIITEQREIFLVENISKYEYWDFGTLERYHQSILSIAERQSGDFFEFIVSEGAIEQRLFKGKYYNSEDAIELDNIRITNKKILFKKM